jgi:hypothetical protein
LSEQFVQEFENTKNVQKLCTDYYQFVFCTTKKVVQKTNTILFEQFVQEFQNTENVQKLWTGYYQFALCTTKKVKQKTKRKTKAVCRDEKAHFLFGRTMQTK